MGGEKVGPIYVEIGPSQVHTTKEALYERKIDYRYNQSLFKLWRKAESEES
jgi:hypothetical protein